MNQKGFVLLRQEFKHTKIWPGETFTLDGVQDTEKIYKEALAGKVCPVLDIAFDGSAYLVLGTFKKGGQFIWNIEKEDTVVFLPVIKKNGIIMPAGMSPIEEFEYMAKNMDTSMYDYKPGEDGK